MIAVYTQLFKSINEQVMKFISILPQALVGKIDYKYEQVDNPDFVMDNSYKSFVNILPLRIC